MSAAPGIDDLGLDTLDTLEDLAMALRILRRRAEVSLRALEAGARHQSTSLSKSTVSDVLAARRIPAWPVLEALITACAVPVQTHPVWRAAWERVIARDEHDREAERRRLADAQDTAQQLLDQARIEAAEICQQAEEILRRAEHDAQQLRERAQTQAAEAAAHAAQAADLHDKAKTTLDDSHKQAHNIRAKAQAISDELISDAQTRAEQREADAEQRAAKAEQRAAEAAREVQNAQQQATDIVHHAREAAYQEAKRITRKAHLEAERIRAGAMPPTGPPPTTPTSSAEAPEGPVFGTPTLGEPPFSHAPPEIDTSASERPGVDFDPLVVKVDLPSYREMSLYHQPGCREIPNNARVNLVQAATARVHGSRPCAVCQPDYDRNPPQLPTPDPAEERSQRFWNSVAPPPPPRSSPTVQVFQTTPFG